MSERSTCWSITINNPTDDDVRCEVPGWKLEGQFEVGKEGTRHFQGMLTTNQQRFSAIKRAFPRAHIEPAIKPKALAAYVHKDDTRVDLYTQSDVPTIFAYQDSVANDWDEGEWAELSNDVKEEKLDDLALLYVDTIVKKHIEAGQRGAEWIGINPMWRSSWKKFWRSIIKRHGTKQQQTRQQDEAGLQEISQYRQEGSETDQTRQGSGQEDSEGTSGEEIRNEALR